MSPSSILNRHRCLCLDLNLLLLHDELPGDLVRRAIGEEERMRRFGRRRGCWPSGELHHCPQERTNWGRRRGGGG
jgi:hypothetical protein